MAYKLGYKSSVEKDLGRLDPPVAAHILMLVARDLANNPHAGKQLKGAFKGLFSWRHGAFRVIYAIERDSILVTRIAHRREVYR